VLPPVWQTVTLFNPVVYWSRLPLELLRISDVHIGVSVAMTLVFLGLCLATVWWIFRTGYRLKT
jgi:ABC-2 type transport system permease protein